MSVLCCAVQLGAIPSRGHSHVRTYVHTPCGLPLLVDKAYRGKHAVCGSGGAPRPGKSQEGLPPVQRLLVRQGLHGTQQRCIWHAQRGIRGVVGTWANHVHTKHDEPVIRSH